MNKFLSKIIISFSLFFSFLIFAQSSDLSITQSLNRVSAAAGDYVIITLTATNNGPDNSTDVIVTDNLPTGYTYANSTQSQGTYDSVTGKWMVGTLTAGSSATLSINAKVKVSGSNVNIATISSASSTDSNLANNTSNSPLEFVCTEQILGVDFTATDGVPQTFNQPATNYGFVFDVYSLDNSFNMNINGVDLAISEIQFQADSVPLPGINVQFTDGDLYEVQTPTIYSFTGSAATPLIRVVISPTGGISMFGSKETNGVLFPLRLFNGNTFNIIPWNTSAPNTVVINQSVTGPTTITGRGYGLNIIPCVCYSSPNNAGAGIATSQGITLLQRAGANNDNWPMVRKSAHTVLESNLKGFVITRMAKANLGNITNPQEGMMVYDTTDKCLKLYDGTAWGCFNTTACPR